ncbi:MAG: hypothetical protein KDC00_13045 [Flavobacteriales bacterium]|nr:hypothetical protein [Flavobacteriales bacterium]
MSAPIIRSSARFWFQVALFDLFAAAVIGVLLRAMYIVEIPFVRFRPWLHGHSHTALLGWLFIGIAVTLLHDGGRGDLTSRSRWLLGGLQAAVLTMLVSFPIQGYGAVSIGASTVHMILGYALLYAMWKASWSWPKKGSRALLRFAIGFFVLSTLGILTIGPIIASGNQGTEIYYWSVQFFLHFQFNGWFWFAAMALGVRWAERNGFSITIDQLTMGLWVVSAILTYALAIAWSEPHPAVFATVSIGVALQVWATIRTLRILKRLGAQAHERVLPWARILIGIALVSMAMKVLVQAGVAIPQVAVMAFTVRHYVMGFIHMNTLGTMTCLLLAYAVMHGWCDLRSPSLRTGLWLIASGIVLSELMLFAQGTLFWAGWGLIPGHYWQITAASALIPIGVLVVLVKGLTQRPTGPPQMVEQFKGI